MDQPIKIAIDCRDLYLAKTGTKTYLNELLFCLKNNNSSNFNIIEIRPFFHISNSVSYYLKPLKHLQFLLWKQISLPLICLFKNADVLICTDYFLPLIKIKTKHIVVFHDAFFWEYPSHYNRLWLKLFHLFAIPPAKRADRILVPSFYVRKRLLYYLNHDISKITVVYEAPKSFPLEFESSKLDLDNTIPTPYILHVGTLSKHKNIPFLINAFKIATKDLLEKWHLILVGGPGNSINDDDALNVSQIIYSQSLQDHVHLVGHVNEKSLFRYYSGASGYIFPSYNEGFGLPILEAMKFKLPIAAANNTCLPEIAKNASIYFNPYDITDLVKSIRKIICKDHDVKETILNQEKVLSSYSWQKSTSEIISLCTEIVK